MAEGEENELSDAELKQKVDEILNSPIEDKEKIKRLHELGYSQAQLYRDFGFPKSTVYRELPVRPERERAGKAEEEKENQSKLPLVLKTGKGQEVITPEGIMQYYLVGDGDSGAAMLKGMMLLRAAQLMVMNDVEIMKGQADAQAKAIKPVLDIMEQSRKDMDAAAQRARESNIEIAEIAAAGAAARAVSRIDEKFEEVSKQKADIATVPKPFEGMFARTMETVVSNITNRLMGTPTQQGANLPPGWSDKRQQGGT